VTGRHRLGDPGGIGHRQAGQHLGRFLDVGDGRGLGLTQIAGWTMEGWESREGRVHLGVVPAAPHPVPNQATSHGSVHATGAVGAAV
jgi:hypothetical protein